MRSDNPKNNKNVMESLKNNKNVATSDLSESAGSLKKQLEECDNHLRKVLLGAAKVSRPSYQDKPSFDRFQGWRDDCLEAEKWRSLSLDNAEVRSGD